MDDHFRSQVESYELNPVVVDPEVLREAQAAAAVDLRQYQQTPKLPTGDAQEYDPDNADGYGNFPGTGRIVQQLRAIAEVVDEAQGKNIPAVVFENSPPGSGKSHQVPMLLPFASSILRKGKRTEFRNIIYVSMNYRSPSIEKIADTFEAPPVRHSGLVHDITPDGHRRIRRATKEELKDGVPLAEEASCKYAYRMHDLMSRGFSYERSHSFCKNKCPLRPVEYKTDRKGNIVFDDFGEPILAKGSGDGSCAFRSESKALTKRLAGDDPEFGVRLRCSIEYLEGLLTIAPEFLSQSLIYFDESDQIAAAAQKVFVLKPSDLTGLIARLQRTDMHNGWATRETEGFVTDDEAELGIELTQRLLTGLLQFMDGLDTPWGVDHHAVRQHLDGWINEVDTYYTDDSGRLSLPVNWLLDQGDLFTSENEINAFVEEGGIEQLPSPLLPLLVHCVLGHHIGPEFEGFALSVTKPAGTRKDSGYRITLTSPSDVLERLAEASYAVIVADATADAQQIKRTFANEEGLIAFRHIKSVEVAADEQADIKFFQIKDLGACGRRKRSDALIRRIDALRNGVRSWAAEQLRQFYVQEMVGHIDANPLLWSGGSAAYLKHKAQHNQQVEDKHFYLERIWDKVGFIEHAPYAKPGDGKWFTSDARGGNRFQQFKVLVLIGRPISNINALLAQYVAQTGDFKASVGTAAEENSAGFRRFQAQDEAAHYRQAWERLRPIRRKGETLIVLFVSNADLSAMPITITQLKPEDVAPDAAAKVDQKFEAICTTIVELAADGTPISKISSRKVANAAGVGERTARRIAQHQTDGKPWGEFVRQVLKQVNQPP